MDLPNTPLPPVPYQTFNPRLRHDADCQYTIPSRIVNPTTLAQIRLNPAESYSQCVGSQSALKFTLTTASRRVAQGAKQTRRFNATSLLSLPESHRGSLHWNIGSAGIPCGLSETGSGIPQTGVALPASANQRPARSYIRSWRREVGEAATDNAEQNLEKTKENLEQFIGGKLGAFEVPYLEQRKSTFSVPQKLEDSQDEQERVSDVQQDLRLNTVSLAVSSGVAAEPDRDVDIPRKQIITQERFVSDRQVKQQSQEQKKALAEKMVDTVHDLICSTWPSACDFDSPKSCASDSEYDDFDSSAACATAVGEGQSGLIPLRGFIKEILRRSKSSCATLRCAEWYLLQVRRILCETSEDSSSSISTLTSEPSGFSQPDLNRLPVNSPLMCPRRAFLSALIVAHKFLHDRVYSNRAWAKVSGLEVTEIGKGELALACLLDWKLWVGREDGSHKSGTPEHDETSWFSAVGQQLPIPLEGLVREQPEDANAVEMASQCTSTGSSPSPSSASAILPESAPGLNVLPAGSVFPSMAGSFAFISPALWDHHCADATGHPRSAATILSSSMPGLSLDGLSDSSVSPVTTEKDGEIRVILNGEEQSAVHIVSSPQSYTERSTARCGYNRLKRGSPVEENHIKSTHMHVTQKIAPNDSVAGKRRRVSNDRICSSN